MTDALIVQQSTSAQHLVLLFHGVGASPQGLLPLADLIARADPRAWVVSVRSPHPSDLGGGWQWFSVRGVTEEDRIGRVAQAMPDFIATVRHWQHEAGLGAAATTLVGFSQGSIMALEATQEPAAVAGCVVSIAGRFAQAPRTAPRATTLHLIHGEQDAVIDPRHAIDAAERLAALGARPSLDLVPALGHSIDKRVADLVIERMSDRPAD